MGQEPGAFRPRGPFSCQLPISPGAGPTQGSYGSPAASVAAGKRGSSATFCLNVFRWGEKKCFPSEWVNRSEGLKSLQFSAWLFFKIKFPPRLRLWSFCFRLNIRTQVGNDEGLNILWSVSVQEQIEALVCFTMLFIHPEKVHLAPLEHFKRVNRKATAIDYGGRKRRRGPGLVVGVWP